MGEPLASIRDRQMDHYHGAASLVAAVIVAPAWVLIDPVIDLRWWMWIIFALFVYGAVAALFQWALFDSDPRVSNVPGSRTVPQAVKVAVAARDGGRCRKCGSGSDLQYDHVVPYSLGGRSDEPSNIQLLCGRCNRRKGNRSMGPPIGGNVAAGFAAPPAATRMESGPPTGQSWRERRANSNIGDGVADRFCGNCGGELRPGDRFCVGCGRPVRTTTADPGEGTVAREGRPLFDPGKMNVLEGDRDVLTEDEAQGFLARHARGDFGLISEQDREFNLENIGGQAYGGGIAVGSRYPHPSGKIVRVVTSQWSAEDAAELEADLVNDGLSRRDAHEYANRRSSRVYLDDPDRA